MTINQVLSRKDGCLDMFVSKEWHAEWQVVTASFTANRRLRVRLCTTSTMIYQSLVISHNRSYVYELFRSPLLLIFSFCPSSPGRF